MYSELTDEHFKAIGKIVVEWSNIEFLLGYLLSRLLVTPSFLARSYTDRMNAAKIQEAIVEATEIHKQRYGCKIIPEEVLDEIINLNNKVRVLRGKRNKFAHFCWTRSNDNEIFGTNLSGGVPNSKKGKKGYITYTVSELAEFYKEAYEIVDKLSQLAEILPEMEEDGLTKKLTRT